ncbi:MAG: peptide MFS transporter [Deltaproteobacteria bacterium]|nr:peptide MFS transporter [Deltaproteobacteria bacterium]
MAARAQFFGHPKGLYFLFFTEMWERFSYYGMQALLVLYMIRHLAFTQEATSRVFGLYTGLVYFTPFFGGLIADRFIGRKKSVITGGLVMAFGHFIMAFESMFFPALFCLVIGCGFFKPNISPQVGALYEPEDSRRDRAFGIFYMGINLGAFFSPLVCGTIGEKYGFHYGFTIAGIGMVLGLIVYLSGMKYYPVELKKTTDATERPETGWSRTDRQRLFVLVSVIAAMILFWAAFNQMGNTIELFADEETERTICGHLIPASWILSLNPMFIFLLTPLVTGLWAYLARKGKEPGAVSKIVVGGIILGLAFMIMFPPAYFFNINGKPVSLLWLVSFSLAYTVGELCFSPIGLSFVYKMSPVRCVSMMMGLWFMGQFIGNLLSGWLGEFYTKIPKELFFAGLGILPIIAAIFILLYNMFYIKKKLR